jgi:hypothetical protein
VLGQVTGNTTSLDSPRPGFGGSHHLPPYSILYVTPPHPHLNGTFSRDSQSGVPKLSWFGFPRLWALITFRLDLRLRWGLKRTCNSPRELSNSMSHSTCTRRDQVDSRLLVVRNQTASLTPGPSFNHNLCYRCPNGSCEPFWTSTLQDLFNGMKNTSMWGVLTPAIRLWVFGSLEGFQVHIFWECESHPHTPQSGVVTNIVTSNFFCL